jgi:GntR family transcriptional regulator, transcriptional activator for L-galactonate catabolism
MSSPQLSALVRRCINELCERLRSAQPGDLLDGEQHLAEELGVSRSPLRQALAYLEERGVLVRRGRGTELVRIPKRSDRSAEVKGPLSRADAFAEWFLTAISERRLRPGQRFTEVEVAAAAGVTTITAREVLARYEARRLIAKDPRRSWSMIQFNAKTIAELWELRRLVEHHALAQICRDPQVQKEAGLSELLAEHRRFARGSYTTSSLAQFRDLDRRFHAALFAASDNQFLDDLRSMIDLLIHVQLADDEIGREGMRRGIAEHAAILAAILAGDQAAAQKALSQHMDSSEHIMNRAASRDAQE